MVKAKTHGECPFPQVDPLTAFAVAKAAGDPESSLSALLKVEQPHVLEMVSAAGGTIAATGAAYCYAMLRAQMMADNE